MGKVVVAGGSGFIGAAIVREAALCGHEVVVLSRSARAPVGARGVAWDGRTVGAWAGELDGADAVVNLTGASLVRRWTPKYWEEIRSSRLDSARAVGEAAASCSRPPKAWVNASAVGYYGDCGPVEVSEARVPASTRLGLLCQEWEAAVTAAQTPGTKKTLLRIGIVLGRGGGFVQALSRLPALGPLGSGRHYLPWIHVRDVARMALFAAEAGIEGAVNATAPRPATYAAVVEALRKALGKPPAPPLPRLLVRLMCKANGWDEDMLLASCRAVPQVALARGFEFSFPELGQACADAGGELPAAWRAEAGA
jgi:uncharacterized protein (TIGR01777 family)